MTKHQATIEKIAPQLEKWGGHVMIQPMHTSDNGCVETSHRHYMDPEMWRLSVWINEGKVEVLHVGSAQEPIDEALDALLEAFPDIKIQYTEVDAVPARKLKGKTDWEGFVGALNEIIEADQGFLEDAQRRVEQYPGDPEEEAYLRTMTEAVAWVGKLKSVAEHAIERRAAAQSPTP